MTSKITFTKTAKYANVRGNWVENPKPHHTLEDKPEGSVKFRYR